MHTVIIYFQVEEALGVGDVVEDEKCVEALKIEIVALKALCKERSAEIELLMERVGEAQMRAVTYESEINKNEIENQDLMSKLVRYR